LHQNRRSAFFVNEIAIRSDRARAAIQRAYFVRLWLNCRHQGHALRGKLSICNRGGSISERLEIHYQIVSPRNTCLLNFFIIALKRGSNSLVVFAKLFSNCGYFFA
jgi:hypothetical protein